MAQSDFGTIDPDTKSGSALATDLNAWRTALHSGHSGTTRPTYAVAGMTWTNTSTNPYIVYFYDGTDDIAIGTVNTTTNVFTPAGISAGTSGGTATAFTYTPAIPSTGNLENQEYDIEFHTAAGTTPTLSVSGQTALSIKYRDVTGTLQAITSSTTPSGWRSRIVNDGTYWVQREVAPGSDITSLSAVTGVAIHGTNTNDSAAAGYVGEYIESIVASASSVSSSGSGQWFDVTSISLTAGDWDISAVIMHALNGATSTACQGFIGTVSGNNNTGLSYGANASAALPPTSVIDVGIAIPNYRVSIASTTTYYLKSLFVFSAGTPKAYGRISARRVR